MISIRELAAACGVSISTVSKALNNQKDVSEKTRERVRKKTEELGYFPNSAAKALKTSRTQNIGVLFADEAHSGLTHDFFSHVLDSFKRTIEEHDYDMTMINCSSGRARNMTYLEKARSRSFDGIIIACIDFADPQVRELLDSDIPVVMIDYLYDGRIGVCSDNVGGMRELVEYVYGMGHRKIAYIHGADSSVTKARLSSFLVTSEELGLHVPEEYVLEGAYRSTDDAYRMTMKLLDLPDPPTCILYPDDFASFGGINAIRERGMDIPADISIAGYDGIRIGRHVVPQLTTIRQDTEAIGATAAEKLIGLIESPRTTIIQPVTIPGTLYEGSSVRDIREDAQKRT